MKYAEQFYAEQREGSLCSAREVVPLILELVNPRSVVDVGCGVGTWLSVFVEIYSGCISTAINEGFTRNN